MSDGDLASLARVSRLSPQQLKQQHPELFARVAAVAADRAKEKLASQLRYASPEGTEGIKAAPVDVSIESDLKAAVVRSIREADVPEAVRTEATERLEAAPDVATVVDPLPMDVPIANQPLLTPQLARAKVSLLGQSIGLAQA